MPATPAQIDLWRSAASEHQRLEFKEARNQYEWEKLCEYCVAPANEGGGHLLLGVADKPPRSVVGSAAYPNPVKTAEQLFQHVGFRVDVEAVAHPGGRVVVFVVPPRPRGTAYHLGGKYLMRSGASLVPMSEDRLRAIFAEGQPDWLEQPAAAGLSPAEVVDRLDTQAFFDLTRRPYPTDQAGVLARLAEEQLIDPAGDGSYAVRRIGGLLLAKRLDLFPDLARRAARVVVYDGASKLKTRLDQTWSRGYAAGFRDLVGFVMSQLPQNEVIRDALRTEVKMVPQDAIREVVANALVHQDLTMTGASPMVEVYADRVEITNPGLPLVPVDRFIDGYQSRNERLADLMRRMHICEEKSSGIDRVVTAAEVFQLPAPDFRSAHQRTNVVIFGPRDFEGMDRDDRIRACYQHCVLKYVMAQPMTNQTMRERFKLPEEKSATASQIITATIDAGQIKADIKSGSSKRYARYLPAWA